MAALISPILASEFETVTHERGSRDERVMVLGDFGDPREGRFEYQARDLPLRRQVHGNSRSE